MIQPYEDCPRFQKCNVNVCPLDSDINDKFLLEGEDKCRVEKPTRLRIGSKYSYLLPHQGFTKREVHNKEKWDAKSPAEKELIATRLEKARKLSKEVARNRMSEHFTA